MANLDQDDNPFEGYNSEMERMAQRQAADEAMYAAHEEWRKTTWQGKVVGMIQALGHHFRPFFMAVSEAIREEQSARILGHLIRVVMVLVAILALYAIANIIQTIIGKEIVIVEEIVILEEVKQSDLDDENEKGDESVTLQRTKRSKPRSSRDKKTQ